MQRARLDTVHGTGGGACPTTIFKHDPGRRQDGAVWFGTTRGAIRFDGPGLAVCHAASSPLVAGRCGARDRGIWQRHGLAIHAMNAGFGVGEAALNWGAPATEVVGAMNRQTGISPVRRLGVQFQLDVLQIHDLHAGHGEGFERDLRRALRE